MGDEAVAKDVTNFKKTTERQVANIDRQTASVEQAAEREGQLSQQRINSVTKAIERTNEDAESAKEKGEARVKEIEESATKAAENVAEEANQEAQSIETKVDQEEANDAK